MTNTNNNKVLADFPDYILITGENRKGELVYKVVNKETNVEEIKTFVYPQALTFIEQLQAMLDAVRDEASDAKSSADIMSEMTATFAH